MKIKRIAGLAALCMVSAVAASILTVVCLMLGVFGLSIQSPLSQATTQTSTGVSPTPTTEPTVTPTVTTIAPTPTPEVSGAADGLTLLQNHQLVEDIYQMVSPSVVGIEVVVTESGTSISQTNAGSGLILSKTGDIVTNAGILSIALDKNGHVMPNATISIKIKGIEQVFLATLTGRDMMTGLAVLKINPLTHVLTPGKFGSASDIKVGQMVLAVGFPDIQFSSGGLTNGLITGIYRIALLEDGTPMQLIQTNAPVSLNSSGGPLVNLDGEIIGLTNCAIQDGPDDLMGCVLPGSTVRLVANDLIKNGEVTGRSWVGITVLNETGFLALQKLYGFPDGVYVSSVNNDGPAYTANLRVGDIIVEINGEKTATSMNLIKYLQGQPVGSLIEITVFRRSDNKTHDLKVYTQEKFS